MTIIDYKDREQNSKIDFFVYSRYMVESIEPHHNVPHIIISITSAPDDRAKLPICTYTIGVLRLSFADSDKGENAMTDAHATELKAFIGGLTEKFERIIVHCDAGYSRSPAIAAALSKHYNGTDKEFFERYKPNMLVYRKVLNAFGQAAK
jgi:predicted protein tyrosine phosphatase